ncbi:MAG: hypothetical protein M1836_002918 [Candelina mexicana]|nr:MAG: hypothetical protein M1836_002918 [Candelina mexicana]
MDTSTRQAPRSAHVWPEGPPDSHPDPTTITNDATLLHTLRLDHDPQDIERHISSIKTVEVQKLKTPYPVRKHWVSENDRIHGLWDHQISFAKMKDVRTPRRPIHDLDVSRIRYVVEPGESVRFIDNGRIVNEIQRNFIGDPGTLAWLDEVVLDNCQKRLGVRRDDSGTIIQMGYTCGLRSEPRFTWARNLLSNKCSEEELKQLNYQTSSAYALFWNVMKVSLPKVIVQDTTNLVAAAGLPPMDCNLKGRDPYRHLVCKSGNQSHMFTNIDLAPACGVAGGNYARFVHREGNANNYVTSLTTHRDLELPSGGNFFNADYGILIKAATNTCVVHRSTDYHGTTLLEKDPNEKTFLQRGLSIYLPPKTLRVWDKYKQEITVAGGERGQEALLVEEEDGMNTSDEESEEDEYHGLEFCAAGEALMKRSR